MKPVCFLLFLCLAGLVVERPAAEPLDLDDAPLLAPWTGDLDGMLERRAIRVLVTYSLTEYFLDRGTERGLVFEHVKGFEKSLNRKYKLGRRPLRVIFVPVRLNEIFEALVDGRGDLAASHLTVTPDREELVEFSDPLRDNVHEIVVTSPDYPPLQSLEDLSGREIHVRLSSSYHFSLKNLNARLKLAGREPVTIWAVDENLETEDTLEMVNAGLLPATVVENFFAEFWGQFFKEMRIYPELRVREHARIAAAWRKNSPKLAAEVNAWIAANRQGRTFGNIVLARYLKDTRWVRNATHPADLERLRGTVDLFQKYADRYAMDWLLVAAQAYRESGLQQSARSRTGAVGVMQVLPSTARDRNVRVGNIHNLENNIHAGVKYMRFIMDYYFDDEDLDPVNRQLFALAAYNAGPNRIARLRGQAAEHGLDPNQWFNSVEELVAARVGREPVHYVRDVYKYYVAYRNILQHHEQREEAREPLS